MLKFSKTEKQKHKSPHLPPAVFARGIRGSDPILHDGKSQIAFVGRSNVGKSSTINALLGGRLARTSSTPGKTQEINFFEVGGKAKTAKGGSPDSWNEFRGYFVDLPGYGYAKMPEKEKEKIRKHILWYLAGGETKPKLIVLILDSRIGVTAHDRELIHVAHEEKHPLLLLLNKIDKLTKNERAKALAALAQEFPDAECITFSATKKDNLSLVRTRLFALLGIHA
ncbi:MAG: ribosome biogenesis GTP-binding protein YihA/YsxC [bacterium]|nr:ribosome biogenesis GTP-binding protein YihA/YsxC [bacterium]